MFQAKAMVHSLKAQDDVTILHEKGSNDVIAEYKGVRCTAIFNPFAGMFYVDDIYGVLPDQHKCPSCGEYVA
ncbi:MAG: hypothetical protein NC389_17565 [Acetatifactor muris]|nr:hypothetical protein [Acetatifactor muris]